MSLEEERSDQDHRSDLDPRAQILKMVEDGRISVNQAIELIATLPESIDVEEPEADAVLADAPVLPDIPPAIPPSSNGTGPAKLSSSSSQAAFEEALPQRTTPSFNPGGLKWRHWWWIPMWVGVFVTVVGASFMYLAWQSGGLGFWFILAWLPFLLGVAIMALAWASRTSRWLHVRITQKRARNDEQAHGPEKISISLPLPLRPAAWLVRIFRPYIPKFQETNLDELILALEHTSPDQPFYVEVDEEEDGEHVEVYIG